MHQLSVTANAVAKQPMRHLFNSKHYRIVVIDKTGNDFLVQFLQQHFNVFPTYNSHQGLESTLALVPQLVLIVSSHIHKGDISDAIWMKNNVLCSHIPIVFISSNVSNQLQIDCLHAGIDGVYQSTIDNNVLSAQIMALIKGREHLKAVYKQNQGIVKNIDNDSFDDSFLKRAHQVVIDNYTNSSFNIDQFVRLMNVSRTMLYVKIKKLTNKSTSEYVRDIRLEEAARFLKDGVLNVSEVAFKVGFNDPKYLSKKFKLKFGITPAAFRKGEIK